MTFDCFGTLVDWPGGLANALAPIMGDKTPVVLRSAEKHQQEAWRVTPHRSFTRVFTSALLDAAAEHEVTLSEREVRALPDAWAALRPFGDVEAMLAELRQRGFRLAVLTNCDDDLFEITHRRFERPFDFFVTAGRVRGYKPAPWHFRAFERITGVRKSDWVHVSSSWYHDIAPAEALGIKRVWLDRKPMGEHASRVARHVPHSLDVVDAVDEMLDGE